MLSFSSHQKELLTAALNGQPVQDKTSYGWKDVDLQFLLRCIAGNGGNSLRVKPPQVKIDNVTFNAPLSKAPEIGTHVYLLDLEFLKMNDECKFSILVQWKDTNEQRTWLDQSRLFSDYEDAVTAGKLMLGSYQRAVRLSKTNGK